MAGVIRRAQIDDFRVPEEVRVTAKKQLEEREESGWPCGACILL